MLIINSFHQLELAFFDVGTLSYIFFNPYIDCKSRLVTADEELVMDKPSLYRAKWRGREPIDVILRSINEDGLYVVTSPPGKKHKKGVPKHWTVKELFKEAKAEVWDTL